MARINPTRSELLKLKKRIKLAERGHKLLKEKRDGLMVQFIKLVNESKKYRAHLDEKLDRAFTSLSVSRALMRSEDLASLFMGSEEGRTTKLKTKYLMATKVPNFVFEKVEVNRNYGFYGVPSEVDTMAEAFADVLPDLVKLAEIEKAIKLLAQDVEKTRRRVNALEHIIVPNLKKTAKGIKMKLDEMERSSFSTVMIVKSMIEAKEEAERNKQKPLKKSKTRSALAKAISLSSKKSTKSKSKKSSKTLKKKNKSRK